MNIMIRTNATLVAAALLSVSAAGCDLGLDLTNPNAPTEQQALSDLNGVVATAVGMQNQFAGGTPGQGLVINLVRAPGLVTDEMGPLNRTLASDLALYEGGSINPTFLSVSQPYANAYRVIRIANNLLVATPPVTAGAPGLQAGILSLARLHKAMALGMLVQQYQQVPLNADIQGAPLQPRAVVLDTVLALLDAAQQDIANVSDADLAAFRTRVLDPNFNLRNTIRAMKARYSLMAGRHQQAIDAAATVDTTVFSAYSYTGTDVNPIYNYAVELRYIAPLRSWAREAEPGDRRVGFWVDSAAVPSDARPGIAVATFRQYSGRNDPFPVYLPGEMLLIQAEGHARLGNLSRARQLINQVRTQCTTTPREPAACLPALGEAQLPTLAALLDQIAYERRYELYLQGLRWEDIRRLQPASGRARSNFLPLPQSECQTNPAVTC